MRLPETIVWRCCSRVAQSAICHPRRVCLAAAVFAIVAAANVADATTIADWTFETSQPTTSGPISPEIGSGSATASHAVAATYSSPSGNGSPHSYSSDEWKPNDYWQFEVSTLGLSNIELSWMQGSDYDGPGGYILQYSTDGTHFTNFGSSYAVPSMQPYEEYTTQLWQPTGPPNTSFDFAVNLSSVTSINNKATVYFRLMDNSTVGAIGNTIDGDATDRVDNFTVFTAPEPASIVLVGLGLLAICIANVGRLKLAINRG